MENLNWSDYYKLPLKSVGVKVFDSVGHMAFDWMSFGTSDDIEHKKVTEVINGSGTIEKNGLYVYSPKECLIRKDGNPYILLRGWGMLTGVGGYNLEPEDAAKVQDDFARWMTDRLNGK